MSTLSKPQLTAEETQKTRARFKRFRILVIGRANAGKTTILRKLCNATGDPIIFSPDGKKIELSVLNPSLERGKHDIENQMVFEGNTGFIFHDSCGFEAGGVQELKLVQQFIKQRSKAKNVNEQLHAIWYCIPTSDDRPITKAERIFFNECGTGLVPVIVLWTKTDSLDLAKIKQLMKEGNSKSEAMQQAPQKAWADFEKNIPQWFDKFKYPPKAYVMFRKMHEPGADCNGLIEKTAAALSSEELQQLFLSTQENNLQLCVKYGVKRVVNRFKYLKDNWTDIMLIVLGYFPQIYIAGHADPLLLDLHRHDLPLLHDFFDFLNNHNHHPEYHDIDSISRIMSFILSGLPTKYNPKDATYCAIVAAILGQLFFSLHKQSLFQKASLERGAQIYQESTCDTSIKQAVENLFKAFHFHFTFLKFFKYSHIDHELLAEGAIQVALNNLPSMK